MTFEASRRKQTLVLQPRGKALYEDESSFGSKMMAKMGWNKGNGLGKEQNGSVNFIQIRYKNNANGLGFDGLKDNQWTENESQFDNLLKSLNGNPGSAEEQTKPERQSLEEKSKASRARVHYKKFTRGKDVHKYSEKDLANILGKKTLIEVTEVKAVDEEVEEVSEEKQGVYESNLIVNTGLSVVDYFKQKMQSKANKSTAQNDTRKESEETSELQQNETQPEKKKKKKRKVEVEPKIVEPEQQEEPPKKKKSKRSLEVQDPDVMEVIEIESDKETPQKSKKKSKKQKDPQPEPSPPVAQLKKTKKAETSATTPPAQTGEPQRGNNAVYSTNVVQIPSHVAQKLASMAVDHFKRSNIADIVGYGLSEDIEIKIVQTKMGDNFLNTDKYSLYNTDKLVTRQRVNPRKILSKIKRTKKSIQVI